MKKNPAKTHKTTTQAPAINTQKEQKLKNKNKKTQKEQNMQKEQKIKIALLRQLLVLRTF